MADDQLEDSPQVQQDNELLALQSIFAAEVIDNRPPAVWKVWRPLDLLLDLKPEHSSTVEGVHCSLVLRVQCPAEYPYKPPVLSIHRMEGISNENACKLLDELNQEANNLVGNVMIYNLAVLIQSFLRIHNRPKKSIYEEMLADKLEREKLALQDRMNKDNIERQRLEEEVQHREEMLKMEGREARRKRDSQCQEEREDAMPQPELVFYAENKISPNSKLRSREKSADVQCRCPKGIVSLRVAQRNSKKVHIGKCIAHSVTGAITHLAIDAESGEHLIVKKWCLKPTSDLQARTKQMSSIELDLSAMSRLKAPSLTPYVAMETLQETDASTKKNYISVYLMRSFVLGTSLKHFKATLNENSDSSEALKLVRHVANGVFGALAALHRVGVVHRDIRSENVYLEESGLVKLVNASLDVRLNDIVEGTSYCDSQSKSQDVHSAALLLLSLVSNPFVTDHHEVPSHLPSAIKDFFLRCLTEEEQVQWSAEQLLTHQFLLDAPARGRGEGDRGDAASDDDDRALARALVQNSVASSGGSRLHLEFEILEWLGRGAFGDVIKVRNKLDGGDYAIKRIELNPESVQLNKKITREVKLLSRLNHESVVRYYNAWIETMDAPIFPRSESQSSSDEESVQADRRTLDKTEEAIAKLGVRLDWTMSEQPPQRSADSISESDSDDEASWIKYRPEAAEDSDSSVEFDDGENKLSVPSRAHTEPAKSPTIHQVLFIQMEFCEKNTLRQAIDNGLYLEKIRCWRLFREIVEGLAHVHQRGMIHRDLKPVNIFLDSNDHVKIGDFGLATKLAFAGLPITEEEKREPQEDLQGSLTGQIGTALYVAPELLQSTNKLIYNQKVDIYSLGIILFEMFHPSLQTGMERIKVITELRSKDIVLPESFRVKENMKQIHVITWMLNHDASARPSCAELLSSEHVPRAVPAGALSSLIGHTLRDKRSKGYRRLVEACLDQRFSPAEDLTFDSGLKIRHDPGVVAVRDIVVEVFRKHGAVDYCPPLLVPRSPKWDKASNAVRLMTSAGSIVHLPHDLRLPFARHIAFTNTKYMRRYTVDKVFREKHVAGFHPREMLECAFDIITPQPEYLWPDAELLYVANSAITATGLTASIQLNHTAILRLVLQACGIPCDKHPDLYPVLVDVRTGRITNLQLQTHLTSLCLNANDTALLLRLIESEVSVENLRDLLSPVGKKTSRQKMDQAIHDIEMVVSNTKALGAQCTITVVPCLAYNATQHEGIFWQALSVRPKGDSKEKAKAKPKSGDLVAAGGRYDALVEEFRKIDKKKREERADDAETCAVGFVMSLERIAAIAKKVEVDLPDDKKKITLEQNFVCVCQWGSTGAGQNSLAASRRAFIAREMWSRGMPCVTLECRTETDARELTGAGVVVLVHDEESSVGYIAISRPERKERRLPLCEVADFIQQNTQLPQCVRSPEVNRTISWTEAERSPGLSVTATLASDKSSKDKARSRVEANVVNAATALLTGLGVTARVLVVGLECEAAVVRRLAAELDSALSASTLAHVLRNMQAIYPKHYDLLSECMNVVGHFLKSSDREGKLLAFMSIPDNVLRLVT